MDSWVDGVKVVILFLAKSPAITWRNSLTTLGKNIKAIESRTATFDDCKIWWKQLSGRRVDSETSINLCNILMLLVCFHKCFYFLFPTKRWSPRVRKIDISVPSAILEISVRYSMAKAGQCHAIIFNRSNQSGKLMLVPRFMSQDLYTLKPSLATISRAMELLDPSNFIK